MNATYSNATGGTFKNKALTGSAKTAGLFAFNCRACMPGYKPVLVTAAPGYVVSCSAITNCDSTNGKNWLNSCSKCSANYAYKYILASKSIDYA